MLAELRISGSAIVEDLEIDLGSGLTVITGETGTGKTTLLTALALLMGGKPEGPGTAVRQDRMTVEGVWTDIPPAVVERIRDAGGDLDDGQLVLRRTISADGRTRAFAGGASVPAAVLAEVGEMLTAIHGQADQLLLRRPAMQRDLVDAFAGAEHLARVAEHGQVWKSLQQACTELRALELDTHAHERAREAAQADLEAIDAIDPVAGEDNQLRQEASRLEALEDTVTEVAQAALALDGDPDTGQPGVNELLTRAIGDVRVASQNEAALAEVVQQLMQANALINDAQVRLAQHANDLDAEPGRLDAIQQRRALLTDLMRRFATDGEGLEGVLRHRERARALIETPSQEERCELLAQQIQQLQAQVDELAMIISQTRRQAADTLSQQVTAEIRSLAMPTTSFEALVSDDEASAYGCDAISFTLRHREGADGVAIAKSASGGELSRIMLALEVVATGADPVGTFVFDEVDAGVGGRSAVDVGLRLGRLGNTGQVIVVTHLPQVAAFGSQHVAVVRPAGADRAHIEVLADESRIEEITRMLAGLEGSQAGQAHAEELVQTARQMLTA